MKKINLNDAADQVQGFWNPLVLGELNGQSLKLAKFGGEFDWHKHEHEDEAFLVVSGAIEIEFEDGELALGEGDLAIVPRGVMHRPKAREEALVLLFEPSGTVNTGDVVTEKTRTALDRLDP
jgi:mannose-6-phosphate isomerase-like protein (cupin superfamily)